jgi:hypothetical protein
MAKPGFEVHDCFVVIQREFHLARFVHKHVILWPFFILYVFELTFVPFFYDFFGCHILSHKDYFSFVRGRQLRLRPELTGQSNRKLVFGVAGRAKHLLNILGLDVIEVGSAFL